LNQRAFRQRQRSGEHQTKQYKPRSDSAGPYSPQDEDEYPTSPLEESPVHQGCPSLTDPNVETSNTADYRKGQAFDELAQLINRNFFMAAATNAHHLGIDLIALQRATPILTPRGTAVPETLQPVQLQHQIPHDAMIDIIPHARLRHNVLRAIASQQLNAAEFSSCLRASGALESGQWQRGGLVVWSSPDQLASWELSETFVKRFPYLLQGCEDLLASTNAWRSRRGEKLFPQSIGR
jgi:hypothetical protein